MTTEQVFRHTADMGEISGFGGGYETTCQSMLEAGVKWLNERGTADLRMSTIENVYGILRADSEDAKTLEKAILAAANNDCTGAMHQAVMSRLAYIAKNGWDSYCAELRKHEAEEVAAKAPGPSNERPEGNPHA